MKKSERVFATISENTKGLFNELLPVNLPGRELFIKLLNQGITKPISSFVIKPITDVPSSINDTESFVQTGEFNVSNYLAYGTGFDGKERLLYNDKFTSGISHDDMTVDIDLIRRTFTYDKPFSIITVKHDYLGMYSMYVYYYIR